MSASAVFKTLSKLAALWLKTRADSATCSAIASPPGPAFASYPRALERRIFFAPKLAIGEGFRDGELEIIEGDLYDFLDLCMANLGNLPHSRFHRWAETLSDKVALWQTFNPIHKAAGKVRHHYDLSGHLFDLFLDADRQYSCA